MLPGDADKQHNVVVQKGSHARLAHSALLRRGNSVDYVHAETRVVASDDGPKVRADPAEHIRVPNRTRHQSISHDDTFHPRYPRYAGQLDLAVQFMVSN